MDLIAARLASQGLTVPLAPETGASAVVRRLVGLQAQDDWVAPYVLRPRVTSTDPPEDAVVNWLMRGTLHMVAAADAGWLTRLLGPVFVARTQRRRLQLELTDAILARAVPRMVKRLPATREELLATVKVPEGQARAYLLAYAGMTGEMVRRGDVYEPMPSGEQPEDPLAELARRYTLGYGPAEAADFAAWSGLPLTTARKVSLSSAENKAPKPRRVILLGHLDPYLLGYKDRTFALDPAHAPKVQRGGGFLQPVVLVDGRVRGVWSRKLTARRMEISVDAFGSIPAPGLREEVENLGRYFGTDATLAK